MNLDRANTPAGEEYATVHVAFELSKAKWRLGIILPGAKKISRYTIDGGDTAGLSVRLSQARAKAASYGKPVRILSCYEAGFDGHAPLVGGSGGDRLRGRSVEYRGEPSGAARQDRSDRSGQIDADVPRLYKGRTAGLQHAACADGGRRRPQTADARAGAPAPGAHGTQQSYQGAVACTWHPRCDADEAWLHRISCNGAHGRRTAAVALAQGRDHPRARAVVPGREAYLRAREDKHSRAAGRSAGFGRGQGHSIG